MPTVRLRAATEYPPAAQKRPESHRSLATDHHPERNVELGAKQALRKQEHGNDAHRLLRIVAAVTEREGRRRDELRPAEPPVQRRDTFRPVEGPEDDDHERHSEGEPDER